MGTASSSSSQRRQNELKAIQDIVTKRYPPSSGPPVGTLGKFIFGRDVECHFRLCVTRQDFDFEGNGRFDLEIDYKKRVNHQAAAGDDTTTRLSNVFGSDSCTQVSDLIDAAAAHIDQHGYTAIDGLVEAIRLVKSQSHLGAPAASS